MYTQLSPNMNSGVDTQHDIPGGAWVLPLRGGQSQDPAMPLHVLGNIAVACITSDVIFEPDVFKFLSNFCHQNKPASPCVEAHTPRFLFRRYAHAVVQAPHGLLVVLCTAALLLRLPCAFHLFISLHVRHIILQEYIFFNTSSFHVYCCTGYVPPGLSPSRSLEYSCAQSYEYTHDGYMYSIPVWKKTRTITLELLLFHLFGSS